MLKQDFSIKSLLRLTTRNEIIKFSLGRQKGDYEEQLLDISNSISHDTFKFENIKSQIIRNKNVYFTNDPAEHYALKKISSDLKRLYKLSTHSRDDISEQVLKILEMSSSYSLVRIDIKNFYESIPLDQVVEKISNDRLLAAKSLTLLKKLSSDLKVGLPRGLSISPILSELFMRDFDRKIREVSHTYYYARYVDDIIVISFDDSDTTYNKIKKIVNHFGLSINNKFYKHDISMISGSLPTVLARFDYLGYKYIISNDEYQLKRIVNVELSDDKKRKIKTRIIHSLLDYAHSSDSLPKKNQLLRQRLKVLSSNYPISFYKNDEGGVLKGGVYYSNRLVNKPGVFYEFNDFIVRSIFSKKNNFFGNAMARIPISEKIAIKNEICFVRGFKDKVFMDLSQNEMKEIKMCWKHKNHKKIKR